MCPCHQSYPLIYSVLTSILVVRDSIPAYLQKFEPEGRRPDELSRPDVSGCVVHSSKWADTEAEGWSFKIDEAWLSSLFVVVDWKPSLKLPISTIYEYGA
jgi:hypothetical protein